MPETDAVDYGQVYDDDTGDLVRDATPEDYAQYARSLDGSWLDTDDRRVYLDGNETEGDLAGPFTVQHAWVSRVGVVTRATNGHKVDVAVHPNEDTARAAYQALIARAVVAGRRP